MASNGERASEGRASGGGAPSHFLEHEWVLWEHRAPASSKEKYEDNMAKLCEFATVEDYWRLFNNVPKPSEIFYDGKTKKRRRRISSRPETPDAVGKERRGRW